MRISKGYDRVEFLRLVDTAAALKSAIQKKDFPKWVAIRSMYLTSCLETVIEEKGIADTANAEFVREKDMVIKEAFDVFGVVVCVRMQTKMKKGKPEIAIYKVKKGGGK